MSLALEKSFPETLLVDRSRILGLEWEELLVLV